MCRDLLSNSQKLPARNLFFWDDFRQLIIKCSPRGGTQGTKPRSRVQRVFGPLKGLGVRSLVSAIRGLPGARASERLSVAPGRLFRGFGEVCSFSTERGKEGVRFQRSGKRRWPLRGPKRSRFPGCALRAFQPWGFYPRDAHKIWIGGVWNGHFQTPKIIFQRPKFAEKFLESDSVKRHLSQTPP